MSSSRKHCRPPSARWILLVCLCLGCASRVQAEYFSKESFGRYDARGKYPIWSKTWVELEPRVYVVAGGLPYVEYRTGRVYNPVTIAVFGLLAYNRYLERDAVADRTEFLRAAQWLRESEDPGCGCWYYDFDYTYLALDETLQRHWTSAMAQGLAMSVMTRAYWMTGDRTYLDSARKAISPLMVAVKDGGVLQYFSPAGIAAPDLKYYEEYPTRPAPSFTLNGFMFTLLGLYDLSQVPDEQADALFESGMLTLRAALPFYDLGDGSAYDLAHLTRPPRPVHRDPGYHLVHITMLNALGTAIQDPDLLWYRDHWNSYGTSLEREAIWVEHLGIWIARRHWLSAGVALLLMFSLAGWTFRSLWRAFSARGRPAPRWRTA